MREDVVVVFTGKSLDHMKEEGGSGNWRANEARLRRCKWIVATRNRHADWSVLDAEHGAAFIIGRISGIRESRKEPGRHIIEFDRYADVDLKNTWPGNHNPVTYSTLEHLKLNPDSLEWKLVRSGHDTQLAQPLDRGETPRDVIERAKQMIAAALEVSPAAVHVSIQV